MFPSELDLEEEEYPQHIYEARAEKMVSIKDGKPKWRIARFLLPTAQTVQEAACIPHNTLPLLSDILPHNLYQWPLKVVSKGWNCPQPKWKDWVYRLAPKFEPIWIQAGVRDAIFSSTYELRYNQEILLGLIEFWCTHTNTFVFPWGEATITLEDVLILGGYPLVGGDVVNPTDDNLEFDRIVRLLENCRIDLFRNGKSRKPSVDHAAWLKHFFTENGEDKSGEYEHVAFLSLWLSRYVFPLLSKDVIDNHVFPIAVKLSFGTKLALGPAVLANIYRKLREVQQAFECSLDGTIAVPGHLQLLQIWAFERFPALVLGPKSPMVVIGPGEPRMARWHKVHFKLNIPLVRSVLRLPDNFEWRPYAADLDNWHCRSIFYKEDEQLVFDCLSLDDELLSYVSCLRVTELVGTDGCREKYLPNRVAMQFGMDQDVPSVGDVFNFNSSIEIISIFIPSRSFQAGVSLRYFNWWKDSMITREDSIKVALSQRTNLKDSRTMTNQPNEDEEDCDSPAAYGKAGHRNNFRSPSSSISERPFKTKRKRIVHESCEDPTEQFDSSRVHESVGKGRLSARKTDSLQEKMASKSVNVNTGEGLIKVAGYPLTPIDIDDDSDNSVVLHACRRSSKPGKDLEGRIQQLEKMLGVHYD